MKLNRLQKRLRREITTNPKKAAILGLLLLVALYFWAPLVSGWIGLDEPGDEPTAELPGVGLPSVASATTPRAVPTNAAQSKPPTRTWEQLVRSIEQDPATCPVADLGAGRDPFRAVEPEVTEPEIDDMAEEPEPEPAPPVVTPESLGFQLSSTVIGPRRRVALINGRTYHEGRTIAWVGDEGEIEFRLAEIHPRRVVLEGRGERFELAIPRPRRSGRIELFGSGD